MRIGLEIKKYLDCFSHFLKHFIRNIKNIDGNQENLPRIILFESQFVYIFKSGFHTLIYRVIGNLFEHLLCNVQITSKCCRSTEEKK